MNDASLIEREVAPATIAPAPGAATPPAYAGTADDDLPPPAAGDTELRQFVTFTVGDEVFGVDMAPVQEIIRVPEVVHVPLAPQALLGLANLRGKVLPIVSLSRIFGLPDRPADDASRAVVIDLGQPLGFVVDHMASVVGVDLRQIEDVACIASSVRTELLSGLIKDVGGHPMIMVLDFVRLVAAEFAEAATGTRAGQAAMDGGSAEEVQAQGGDELQLVSFMVAGQEYAVAIEDVQEIVQMPQTIVQVPHAEPHVLGIMTLRNRLLPLVSLRHMFGLPPRQQDHSSRIAVVAPAARESAGAVGVVIDTVNEVLRVALNTVEAVPTLLARDQGMADIARICRLDNGKRLVSVIDAVSLLSQPAIETLLEDNEMNQDKQPETRSDDEEQAVVFRSGDEEFGVPIDSVQEIVRVINLRGAVLPVIDLRMRLGLPRVERSDRQRIMVFLIDQVCTGFIVDSVAEVLKIERRAIGPAPSLSSQQVRLLSRMANIEKQKRMIQLVEPRYLVEGEELALLAGMGQTA